MDRFLIKRKKPEFDTEPPSSPTVQSGRKTLSIPTKKLKVSDSLLTKKSHKRNPFAIKDDFPPNSSNADVSKRHVQSTLAILQKLDTNIDQTKRQTASSTQSPVRSNIFRTSSELDSAIKMSLSHVPTDFELPHREICINDHEESTHDQEQAASTSTFTVGETPSLEEPTGGISGHQQLSNEEDESAVDEEVALAGPANIDNDLPTSPSSSTMHTAQTTITEYLHGCSKQETVSHDGLASSDDADAKWRRRDPFQLLGRNTAAPVTFVRDPASYSHPLRAAPSDLHAMIAAHFRASDVIMRLSAGGMQGNGQLLTPKRVGCTCIKFDSDGVLFVVGGSNGVVRVYDFDDVLFASQRASKASTPSLPSAAPALTAVPPIAPPLFTGKDISDIVWLPPEGVAEMTEIAVAFTYNSEVRLYDLALGPDDQPDVCLDLGGVAGRGNASLLACKSSGGRAGAVSVFAGGTYGQVRMWNLPASVRAAGGRVSPLWEVSGDHLSRPGTHSAIVGLQTVQSRPEWVLSVTRMGVVAVWDTSNISTTSFSTLGSPACVLRVCIWDSALLVSPRGGGRRGVAEPPVIIPPPMSMVVGITPSASATSTYHFSTSGGGGGCDNAAVEEREHSFSRDRNRKGLRALADTVICVTLSSGDLFLFDYVAGKLVSPAVVGGDSESGRGSGRSSASGGTLSVVAGCPSGDTIENILPRGRRQHEDNGESDEAAAGVVLAGSALGARDVRCAAVFCEASGHNVSR
jgi:WD40 repeat protein